MKYEKIIGWLKFKPLKKTKNAKTWLIFVNHKDDNTPLGKIKWKCGWRQYWFEPYGDEGFSRGCMRDICTYIDELMEDRKVE